MAAILILVSIFSGCFVPAGDNRDPAEGGSRSLLPAGTLLENATVVTHDESRIVFRWSAATVRADLPAVGGTEPANRVQTYLALPAGATFEIVSERKQAQGENIAANGGDVPTLRVRTVMFDSEGWARCSGRGPGWDAEWREVCRVRDVGPYSERVRWIVRVEAFDGQAGVPFEMELTVRAISPHAVSRLKEVLPFEGSADDGTRLRGHVYVPDGPGPFATILVYRPYWNEGGTVPSDSLARTYEGRDTLVRPWGTFLEAGFAVAAINSRGSGLSDGCYEYMNQPVNGPDANAVIDALAAQVWSNGRVGMYGVSYAAATQFAAIAFDPSPHLGAIVPVSGEWDEWNFLAIWGAAYDGAGTHPTQRNLRQGAGLDQEITEAESGSAPAFQPTPDHVCQDTAMSQYNWDQLIVTGDKTPWLQERDLRDALPLSDVPVFMTNGLTDEEGSHRSTPYDLWNLIHAPQRWMLGQFPHGAPAGDDTRFIAEYANPWFDHYLRDGPAVETGLVEYQDDSGLWNRADRWPPSGTPTELFLSNGKLVVEKSDVTSSTQQVINRDQTVAAPGDCNFAAVFVSDPMEQDLLLAGEFMVNFTVTPTMPNGNVAAYLYRTSEPPTCSTAQASMPDAHLIRYALSDLRHRGHLEQGFDAMPGQPISMSMRSFPFAARVPEDQYLVLVIGAGHPHLTAKPFQPVLTISTGPQVEGVLTFTAVQ